MNSRLRKASALFASVALLGASAVALFATPASATAKTGCEDGPGCQTTFPGGTSFSNGPFNIGLDFSVADPGQLNTICYPVDGVGDGSDLITLVGPYSASGNASGSGCLTLNHAIPAGSYVAYYTSGTNYFQGAEEGPTTLGDLSVPANAGVYSSSGVPTTTGYGDGVNVLFYSNPTPPTDTVTAASTTTASFSLVGDGESGGSSNITAQCTQTGGPIANGTTGGNTGANGPYTETGVTNGQPVVCTAYETSIVGLNSATATAQAFLPPPAPTIGPVTPNGGTSVHVAFTDNSAGATGQTFTATCNQTGHTAQTGTSSTSPITVNGLSGIAPVSCTVHETFAAPNGLSGAESAAGSTLIPPPAPSITSFTPLTAGTTTVAFVPVVTGATYTVTCTPVPPATGTTVTASGTTSPIPLTGLTPDIAYSCTVSATFGNGSGTTISLPSSEAVPSTSGKGCAATTVTAPTLLSSAPGEASATVSWSQGTADPAACYVGSLVTPSAGTPVLILGHGSTTVVPNLTDGTSETFTVAVVTGAGVGPQSVATKAITIGSPTAPAAVVASRVAKGALKVSFRASHANGGPIKKYTATCKSSNGGVTRSTSAKSGPLKVTHLSAGKSYTCSVTATNSIGTSPTSGSSRAVKA